MAARDPDLDPVSSPTLELALRLEAERRAGRRVIGASTPVFPTTELRVAVPRWPTRLAAPQGDVALRQALAARLFERWGASADDLLVVPGAKAGLLVAIAALCRPGGTVAIPTPCWPTYRTVAEALGRRVALRPCRSAEGWSLDPQAIVHGLEAGDLVVLSNPCNPTGRLYSAAEIGALVARCAAADVHVVLDESFSETVSRGLAADWGTCAARERVVVLNSVSKNYLVQGWRIGALLAPRATLQRMERVQTALLSPPPSPMQVLMAAALDAGELSTPDLDATRAAVETRLVAAGVAFVPSGGTFYCYPQVPGLAARRTALERERGVFLLAGTDFLHDEADFFRLCLLQPPGDLDTLLEAIAGPVAAGGAVADR